MSDPTGSGSNNTEQDKLTDHKMEALGLDPRNAAQRALYESDQKKVALDLITQTEARESMNRLLSYQDQKQIRDAARQRQVEVGLIPAEPKRDDSSRTEQVTGNWRKSVLQGFAWQIPPQDRQPPDKQRNQIRLSAPDAGPEPEGPQQEKKQIEVDWRLALTDPAYRRQAREQDRSEQKEKSEKQQQVQGPQLSPGR